MQVKKFSNQEVLKQIFEQKRASQDGYKHPKSIPPFNTTSEIDNAIIKEFELHRYQDSNPMVDNWWGVEAHRAVNNGELPPREMPKDLDSYFETEKNKYIEFLRSDIAKNNEYEKVPSGNVNNPMDMYMLKTAMKKQLVDIIRLQQKQ